MKIVDNFNGIVEFPIKTHKTKEGNFFFSFISGQILDILNSLNRAIRNTLDENN